MLNIEAFRKGHHCTRDSPFYLILKIKNEKEWTKNG